MRAFLDKIDAGNRVLDIGDTRQHRGVDAGRPFQQMQEAGMRTATLSPEKARYIDCGYAVESLKNNRTERVIATGDSPTQQAFQGASPKADLTLYTAAPAPAQELAAAKQIHAPEITQSATHQHDFGISF